jgi:hypothetical protein
VKHAVAAGLAPDIYDDDNEFDEAIELSAEAAGELAKGLTAVAIEFPDIVCPKPLFLNRVTQGVLVETELASWIIRREAAEHLAFLNAMIRPELLDVWIAGSC